MSRPILSRPRTRVYGCNYDKGESYYKPMVDHLDRKYSGRPLFSEPRNSFADEIAARRSDIGSRNLAGNRNGFDEMDFLYDYHGRSPDYESDDDYLLAQRRIKERAAAAFEEDLAELRRKRRDMQDRLFDSVDINKEIKKAKSTLANADVVFQRHAMKFDNADDYEQELSLAQRMARRRQVESQEIPEQRKPQQMMWAKLVPADQAVLEPTSPLRQRLNSIIAENVLTDSAQEKEEVMKRRAMNTRKKSVCF